jgi:hypothetical protein
MLYALQALFRQLRECSEAPEPLALTKAFGWERGDLVQLQDAHEFLQVFLRTLHRQLETKIAYGTVPALFSGTSVYREPLEEQESWSKIEESWGKIVKT